MMSSCFPFTRYSLKPLMKTAASSLAGSASSKKVESTTPSESAPASFGELVEVIFVGPEKGGIMAEAGTEAGVRGVYPLAKQVPGVKQAFFGDVISYGTSCFFLENTHHVVWADAA